jgi:hypothetical protein
LKPSSFWYNPFFRLRSAKENELTAILLALGIALLISDAIHHFVVLKIITGSPEFYLTYPKNNDCPAL